MSAFFFSTGLIWLFIGVGVVVMGPSFGFNRNSAKKELAEFYKKLPENKFKRIPVLLIFCVALFGFFFPAIYPAWSVLIGFWLVAVS